MNRNDEQVPGGSQEPPEELDEGLAFAYGEDAQSEKGPPGTVPSVLGRIGEIVGSRRRVFLRDESAGVTPMLKPLGPDDTREAGKYVVHGELGRGGVGAVHRGHDQDLGRDVAMKFLHERHKDEPALLHRFVEEAQIGGQLQHPGIVPVYDLGMVDGRPFFAMKLVKGQTLAKKLAERVSPSDDRREFLGIFEDVCQTIAYAHARGVVHRDLKPANIMTGPFGEVQVVDWGMGKVLRQGGVADEKLAAERQAQPSIIETVRSGGRGSQSLVGSVMGTPAYMPPEQARGDVEAMDERSDVFALGAILCEILTGAPPYVGDLEAILDMAAIAKLDDANTRLEACGADREMVELAKRCMMPAPAARPRSARVVAQAVHDHVAAVEARVHEARVEAAEAKVRAASLKRAQTLGISLTVVIAAGLAASLWFWRAAETSASNERDAKLAAVTSAKQAEDNEQRAVEQTAIAERELARAVEIKALITGMLQSVTPEQAKGADITLLKGILDTASQRLSEGAVEDELVAAELHALVGGVYQSIGLYPDAELHLPAALELRERLLGEEDRSTLSSMSKLAGLYADQGRYAEAEPLVLQGLEIRKRLLGAEHPDTLQSLGNLATLYLYQGRSTEAESLYLDTLEIRERVLGAEHPDMLMATSNLARLYDSQGRYAEAERLHLQTLEIRQRVLGEEHRDTLASMGNLANLYMAQGRYAEAQPLHLQILEIRQRVLGAEHPDTLASMGNLAILYTNQGRDAEAEPLYVDVLAIRKRVLGAEHPATLGVMGSLASLYKRQGRYAEAEPLSVQTLEIMQRVLGEEHRDTLASMGNLANLYMNQGRDAEAEPLYLDALEMSQRVLGKEHPTTLGTMGNLAALYFRQGRHAETEALILQALKIEARVLGEENPRTLRSVNNLGLLYNSRERFEEAAAMYEVSLPILRRVLGPAHPTTGDAMRGLLTAYQGMGRTDEVLPLQRELLGVQVAAADAVDASASVLNNAAWTLLTCEDERLRDPERALGFALRACALAADDWNMLDTLALAQHETGDTEAAIEAQARALALMPEGADPEMAARLTVYRAAVKER